MDAPHVPIGSALRSPSRCVSELGGSGRIPNAVEFGRVVIPQGVVRGGDVLLQKLGSVGLFEPIADNQRAGFGERLSPTNILGIVLGILGVVLMSL